MGHFPQGEKRGGLRCCVPDGRKETQHNTLLLLKEGGKKEGWLGFRGGTQQKGNDELKGSFGKMAKRR